MKNPKLIIIASTFILSLTSLVYARDHHSRNLLFEYGSIEDQSFHNHKRAHPNFDHREHLRGSNDIPFSESYFHRKKHTNKRPHKFENQHGVHQNRYWKRDRHGRICKVREYTIVKHGREKTIIKKICRKNRRAPYQGSRRSNYLNHWSERNLSQKNW